MGKVEVSTHALHHTKVAWSAVRRCGEELRVVVVQLLLLQTMAQQADAVPRPGFASALTARRKTRHKSFRAIFKLPLTAQLVVCQDIAI